jgi:hypothetical protein
VVEVVGGVVNCNGRSGRSKEGLASWSIGIPAKIH